MLFLPYFKLVEVIQFDFENPLKFNMVCNQ